MKRLFLCVLFLGFFVNSHAFPKLSILERFTNTSCGPCATINNGWYNAATRQMVGDGTINHVIYNVDWPSNTDPMFLLNSADNNVRRGLYGVNAVPWLQVNGSNIGASLGELQSAVTNGNAAYSPFTIEIIAEKFANNVVSVSITITRDSTDVTVFTNTRLFVALTERMIDFHTPPGSNGESIFYNVTRKMLPDAKGAEFTIPEPGASTTVDLMYIPTAQFTGAVQMDSIRVVAFVQNPVSKEVFQSASTDIVTSTRLNAAFAVSEDLGAAPFEVSFSDYSTPGTSAVTSWEWDFDNDGTFDATGASPSYTYDTAGRYSVALRVSDGINVHTRILKNAVTTITTHADILVVNGIERATYPTEMTNFYLNSGPFGEFDVDVWDLFGNQDFSYTQNTQVLGAHYFNRSIPTSILKMYPRVIWLGNNYGGDLSFYNPAQVLEYVQSGGNFLLATRQGQDFFSSDLMQYAGVQSISGLTDITAPLLSLDSGLLDMPPLPTNTRNQLVLVDTLAGAIPIFKTEISSVWSAGFRIKKGEDGSFIYIAGRPYRFSNAISALNYDYIIRNWMTYTPVSNIKDPANGVLPTEYRLEQNFPNPFNPATTIRYALPEAGLVKLSVFNSLGESVAVLVNGEQQAGLHEVQFDGKGASGIFIYKIEAYSGLNPANTFRRAAKMILLK